MGVVAFKGNKAGIAHGGLQSLSKSIFDDAAKGRVYPVAYTYRVDVQELAASRTSLFMSNEKL